MALSETEKPTPKAENRIPKECDESFDNERSGRLEDPLLDCLIIIGKMHDRQLSEDMLTAGLPLVDNRLTPRLLVRTAATAGFSSRIVRRSLNDIPTLVCPCILLLKDNQAALLVGKSHDKKYRVIVPETGTGESEIEESELKEAYTGNCIFIKPDYQFDQAAAESAEESLNSKNWFWGTLWKYKKIYANVGLAALFINIFAIAGTLFVMNVYDRVIPNNATDTLWVLVVGVTIVYAFDFMLKSLRGMLIDKAGKNADVIMSSFIFQRVLGIRMENKPGSAGSFANQVKGYESLREFFTSASLTTIIDIPFVLLFLCFMGMIGGWVAFIPAIGIALILGVGAFMHIPLKRAAEKAHGAGAQKHALLVEAINGFEAIRGLSAAGYFQRKMEECLGKTARSEVKSRRYSTFASNFTMLVTQMASVAIVAVSVYRIQAGDMSMGALIGCTILSGRAMAPISQVAALLSRLQQSIVSLKGLNEMIDLPQERDESRNYIRKDNFEPSISFKDVNFTYTENAPPAVKNATFDIKAGEKVAILGRVGSGKSTLLRLLMGFYQPTNGMALLNETDLRQLDPAEVRRRIGYISQDNLLFNGSLKANIMIGAPWSDEEDMLTASRLSGVERFVSKHPMGYDLEVGERGQNLSGGQKQAVNIARALLYKPELLVMDEPTSAMDANAEREFIKSMEIYAKGGKRTLIISTHKPSMLKLADRIIVMDQGRIAADGPKTEVLRQLSSGAGKN
ncbi:type I secretion system permease/ATPase [Puniceicoccaceae bacterium K14]|nr:type I secretion system permease/ATPase [Puniceicoccaceae bacterium K14]